MTSKVYRHTVTGIETTLDEKFAKVFGDAFEPVTKKATTRKSTQKNEESDSSKNDSSKEGND